MICPDCLGSCSSDEIQLKLVLYDDRELFFCPRCHEFSELQMMDQGILEEEEYLDFKKMRNDILKDVNVGVDE